MKKITAREKILKALINTPSGLTNNELIKIAQRFGARLSELYREGHIIEKTSLGEGVYLYKYKGFKEKVNKDAYSKLAHVLYKRGYDELASNLSEILDEAEVRLHRKSVKNNS